MLFAKNTKWFYPIYFYLVFFCNFIVVSLLCILKTQMLWCWGIIIRFLDGKEPCTDVIVLYLFFIVFEFWDGKQNSVPNVWQIILPNISIQDWLFCDEEYIGESARTFGERFKETLREPPLLSGHQNSIDHKTSMENLQSIGREENSIAGTIKEAMYIRMIGQNLINLHSLWLYVSLFAY